MKKQLLLLNLILTTILCSCSSNNEPSIRIRASAESTAGSNIEFAVVPENSYGEVINGAIVIVRNSKNVINYLNFNQTKQNYSGFFEDDNSEIYTIEVDTNYDDKIHKIEIPHSVLNKKPVITAFSDSSGNSVIDGDSLNPSKEIQIACKSLGENLVYQIAIRTSTIQSSGISFYTE